jgi:hypothetical protein
MNELNLIPIPNFQDIDRRDLFAAIIVHAYFSRADYVQSPATLIEIAVKQADTLILALKRDEK